MKEFTTVEEMIEYYFANALMYEEKGKYIEANDCLDEALSWEFWSNANKTETKGTKK
jgi:hypothetical protein